MSAQTNASPVELGTHDFERISRLLRSAEYALLMYRATPNYPIMQPEKARWWASYQETLAELMEAIHG